MDTLALIVATEAQAAAEGETDLIERIKKCMRASVNHWMATSEDDQFRGAVAAAIRLSDGDEREQLETSVRELHATTALLQGVPIDAEELLKQRGDTEIVPLIKLWHEAKDEAGS